MQVQRKHLPTYRSYISRQRIGFLTFQNSFARSPWENSELYQAPFDSTIYNCSYFESCVAGPRGGGIIHNLFIALASKELQIPSLGPLGNPKSLTSKREGKYRESALLSSANLRHDFREIALPSCTSPPAIGT